MTLIDDYLELQERYESKYGSKTIVLMEVGSFFEIYGVVRDDSTDNPISRGRIYEVADITNLNVTKKCDKLQPVSEKNPLMAGFPSASFDKWKDILLRYGYTIIKIEQEMTIVSGKKEPQRKITEILSPGVYMDTTNVSNHVLSIYIEEIQDHKSATHYPLWFVGIASVDVTTGESYIYETHSTSDDMHHATDEIYRLVNMIRPVEIIVHFKGMVQSTPSENGKSNSAPIEQFIHSLELRNVAVHYNMYSSKEFAHFEQPKFQCEFLRRVFPQTKMLSPIEYLGLERMPFALLSLVYLVEFCYEHNESYIEKWNKPTQWESTRFMECSYDAMDQLHIIPPPSSMSSMSATSSSSRSSQSIQSLWDVLDHTVTAMGRRKLRECIAHPIVEPTELNRRYDIVAHLMGTPSESRPYQSIRKSMQLMVDLDRYHRRILLKLIHPSQWIAIEVSHRSAVETLKQYYKTIDIETETKVPSWLSAFEDSITDYCNRFTLSRMAHVSRNQITQNIFPSGHYPDLDELENSLTYIRRKMNAIQCELSYIITGERRTIDQTAIEWKTSDRDGDFLSTSTSRGNALKEKLKLRKSIQVRVVNPVNPLDTVILSINTDKFEFKSSASSMRIVFPELEQLSYERTRNESAMNRRCMEVYDACLTELSSKYDEVWHTASEEIARCDYLCSFAKSAVEYGYCRPVIEEPESPSESPRSFIDARDIRHPIIERLSSVVQYVANDVSLGTDKTCGILLYGLNAVGKSSLMKSVGLAVVMAQCGSFVPASSFRYNPYMQICTRIQTRDNLFKGQSTFAVEMSELRAILKKAGGRTLVLGDELCSGTETTSGIAIVGATLVHLYRRHSSFLFATHLHDLATLDEVLECNGIRHMHLATEYDPASKKIIYHRKLREGSGTAVYGLEVARALDLDNGFLELANQIRMRRMGLSEQFVGKKTSSYNKNVIINKCSICGKNTEEVHHIREQHTADKDTGLIGGTFHKNELHNLVQLCEPCHLNVHHGNLRIHGYRQTSDGVELNYEYVAHGETGRESTDGTVRDSTGITTRDSDDDIIEPGSDETHQLDNRIREVYSKVGSMKQVQYVLKSVHHIDCTMYRIRKAIKQ